MYNVTTFKWLFRKLLMLWKLLQMRNDWINDWSTSSISQARQILESSGMEKLVEQVKRAIDKTLSAPQVQKLDEVRCWISC